MSVEARRRREPVARAFDLLRAMVDTGSEAYGVRELAETVGLPPSSAHRLLSLLENVGMVARRPGGTYALGMEFHRLAMRSASLMPLRKVASPVLQELRDECEETTVLGLYEPSRREMLFALSLESAHPLRYVLQLNEWVPVYTGATGLAIMAFLPEEEQEQIIAETRLRPLTSRTIQDPDALRQELADIRRRGYALTRGQRVEGAVGIAAPIFDSNQRVVGDVIITLPEFRFERHSEEDLAGLVMRGAKRVTELLSGTPPGGY